MFSIWFMSFVGYCQNCAENAINQFRIEFQRNDTQKFTNANGLLSLSIDHFFIEIINKLMHQNKQQSNFHLNWFNFPDIFSSFHFESVFFHQAENGCQCNKLWNVSVRLVKAGHNWLFEKHLPNKKEKKQTNRKKKWK